MIYASFAISLYNKIMDDKEFLEITTSIEEKIGKDHSAMIADDLGKAITGFENLNKTIKERDEEIKRLKADKEKLVLANGNLLKQIPVSSEDDEPDEEDKKPSLSNFNFKDAFDEHGNFKR